MPFDVLTGDKVHLNDKFQFIIDSADSLKLVFNTTLNVVDKNRTVDRGVIISLIEQIKTTATDGQGILTGPKAPETIEDSVNDFDTIQKMFNTPFDSVSSMLKDCPLLRKYLVSKQIYTMGDVFQWLGSQGGGTQGENIKQGLLKIVSENSDLREFPILRYFTDILKQYNLDFDSNISKYQDLG